MKKKPSDAALPQPSASLSTFISALADEKADAMLVDLAGKAMTEKLAKKRLDGRGGWHQPKPEIDADLRASLREHVDKGDMVDVINLAAMLHVRSEIYGRPGVTAPVAKAKAVRKTAKKKPAAKKPASFKRSTPKRAAPKRSAPRARPGQNSALEDLINQAKPLFKANPSLDREGLIKKIGRRYERITNFAKLRAACLGEKAPAAAKTSAAKPAKAPKVPAAAAPKSKPKPTKPAPPGPWTVKAKGKTLGATIFEKKPGDPFNCSAGFFTVVSIDAEKREIQVETKAEAAARAAEEAKPDSATLDAPKTSEST
jgi:hypothetical protein